MRDVEATMSKVKRCQEMLPVALGAVEAVVTRAAVICVDWRALHVGDPPSSIPEVDGEDEHAGDEEEDGRHIDLQSPPVMHTTILSWTRSTWKSTIRLTLGV